jgi:hypothetical protein
VKSWRPNHVGLDQAYQAIIANSPSLNASTQEGCSLLCTKRFSKAPGPPPLVIRFTVPNASECLRREADMAKAGRIQLLMAKR